MISISGMQVCFTRPSAMDVSLKCDFPFEIAGETFETLWLLVDGIYPSLAWFVKPLSVPIDDNEMLFSLRQEAKRKDIERLFGVFKKNLTSLPTQSVFSSLKK